MAVVPPEVSDSSVERRGSEIFISSALVDMGRSKYWKSNKRWQLDQISKSIAYYEMKEGLTLILNWLCGKQRLNKQVVIVPLTAVHAVLKYLDRSRILFCSIISTFYILACWYNT